jgi:hypothetical protein
MKHPRQALIGICVLAFSSPAFAAPLAPVKASQLIRAWANTVANPSCVSGVTGFQIPFGAPPGSVAVMTSVQWNAAGGVSGAVLAPTIFVGNPAVALTGAVGDNGIAGGSVSLPTGLVVRPGVEVCFGVPGAEQYTVTVEGFLAKDK